MITADLAARIADRITPCVVPEGECLVGFSGGADSTALMYLLASQRDAGKTKPQAVHVNHGLRGEESDDDEAFCRELCEKLRIPFHTVHAELNGKTDEKSCREERFRSFALVMRELRIEKLVLAHNQDDLAETFLMRLMRGAGAEGLSCMSSIDSRDGYSIYRPLLRTGREEIRKCLRETGAKWRDDSLNASNAYFRNRVREKLLPLMNELASGATKKIAQTAEILSRENALLQLEAERFLRINSTGRMIRIPEISEIPEALQCRILRIWWRMNAPIPEEHALNARQTGELAAMIKGKSRKVNLPGGLHAVKGRNGIYLTGFPRDRSQMMPYQTGEIRFGETVLRTVPTEGNPGNGITSQELPAAILAGCVIRTRRPGDRIRPFGMVGTRKLQDYFTDRGIDEPWRDDIPLLCRDNEVLMAAGVGTGAIPYWRPGEENVRLIWTGDLPWMIQEREG